MNLIKNIPIKRNVLIEKNNINSTRKNLFLLKFQKEYFVVRLNSEIECYIYDSIDGYRTIWKHVDVDILSSENGETNNFIKWINLFIQERNISGKAQNIELFKLNDNFLKTGECWILYGCLLDGIINENKLNLFINPNNCFLKAVELSTYELIYEK